MVPRRRRFRPPADAPYRRLRVSDLGGPVRGSLVVPGPCPPGRTIAHAIPPGDGRSALRSRVSGAGSSRRTRSYRGAADLAGLDRHRRGRLAALERALGVTEPAYPNPMRNVMRMPVALLLGV